MSYGYDIDFDMFRGVAGAPGMSEAAKDYWVDILEKVSQDPTWVNDYVNARGLTPAFMTGDKLMEFLEAQNASYEQLAIEAGLIK